MNFEDIRISKEQAARFARMILPLIPDYIAEHQEEYQAFLAERKKQKAIETAQEEEEKDEV